jgi:hypothetical protein
MTYYRIPTYSGVGIEWYRSADGKETEYLWDGEWVDGNVYVGAIHTAGYVKVPYNKAMLAFL